jgi:hypothetical protein
MTERIWKLLMLGVFVLCAWAAHQALQHPAFIAGRFTFR